MSNTARFSEGASAEASNWLLLALPGLIWGASFLFIDEAMRALEPGGVTFTRILIGFVTLSLFPAARRPVPRSDWPAVAWLGVLWLALPLSLFPFAAQKVSSALTGMLNGANALFTAIIAALISRRVPSRGVMAGLGVGITGAILMAWPAGNEGHNSAIGVGMILLALVCYGFALNIARPLEQRNGALPVIWRAQMIALILTAPLGLPGLLAARWMLGPAVALLRCAWNRSGARRDVCRCWQVGSNARVSDDIPYSRSGAGSGRCSTPRTRSRVVCPRKRGMRQRGLALAARQKLRGSATTNASTNVRAGCTTVWFGGELTQPS